VAKGMVGALGALEAEGKIVKSSENYYGRPKTMYVALVRPDLTPFDADEIAIVDMMADIICRNHTAASISNFSHDALWDETELGADSPIGAASVIPGEIDPGDMNWARESLAD